jgi:hypothetical protein
MAEAAVGGGDERAQKHRHPTITTKEVMKAAPAMLKAHPDKEAPDI